MTITIDLTDAQRDLISSYQGYQQNITDPITFLPVPNPQAPEDFVTNYVLGFVNQALISGTVNPAVAQAQAAAINSAQSILLPISIVKVQPLPPTSNPIN